MGYKRKPFGNKKVYVATTLGLLSACAIIGGVMIKGKGPSKEKETSYIVDLNEDADSVGINNGKKVENQTAAKNDIKESKEDNSSYNKENNTSSNNTSDNKVTSDTTLEEETTKIGNNEETTSDGSSKTANNEKTTSDGSSKTANNEEATSDDNSKTVITDVQKPGFTKESVLVWPVDGQVIIEYDMENVVYFPTLDVYKCSDALCIQSTVGTPVYAGADATIKETNKNNTIGEYVTLDLGNGYELTYGSMKDIQVASGATIQKGDLIGYIAEPTKYYSLEGANLYIKMTENGNAIDPLDYLNYE